MGLLVLHTTESPAGSAQAVAAYLIHKGFESHEVFDPGNGEVIQLLPPNRPAKSLMNLPGGVETNRRPDIPYQIEIVGYAADTPSYDASWYATLRARLLGLCHLLVIPYVFPLPFLPYPSSYGNNGVRISFDDWYGFHGIIGHMHCPENDHGDPGAIRTDLLLEDDMTPESWCRMIDGRYGTPAAATRVHPQGFVEVHLMNPDGSDGGWWPYADVVEFTHRNAKAAATR